MLFLATDSALSLDVYSFIFCINTFLEDELMITKRFFLDVVSENDTAFCKQLSQPSSIGMIRTLSQLSIWQVFPLSAFSVETTSLITVETESGVRVL
jgi:hypothetical protein